MPCSRAEKKVEQRLEDRPKAFGFESSGLQWAWENVQWWHGGVVDKGYLFIQKGREKMKVKDETKFQK